MGLGKTLQSIALLWTLLNSGNALLGGKPIAKRIIICCPTSLVSNWDSEIQKWLKVNKYRMIHNTRTLTPTCCLKSFLACTGTWLAMTQTHMAVW